MAVAVAPEIMTTMTMNANLSFSVNRQTGSLGAAKDKSHCFVVSTRR